MASFGSCNITFTNRTAVVYNFKNFSPGLVGVPAASNPTTIGANATVQFRIIPSVGTTVSQGTLNFDFAAGGAALSVTAVYNPNPLIRELKTDPTQPPSDSLTITCTTENTTQIALVGLVTIQQHTLVQD
ncbi:hypothetical protein BDN72DRAFT_881545 [Pluteus cervinus]|uniref:Uncharacterized protein n=1 Tax=Pluteus cervinus TaxID=181527 RepID=A0ACD3AFC1_9AGAR|nr:hypothetical protein BDN72DRAFT_881545 [Pluteus cervinus]